ncbi:MAG: gliding motility-associated C-terminal domain-containing protein [Flavobacteriales bacterium]
MMNKKDELIDLLRDRLGDLEAPVDPALWQGIQGRMVEAAVASGTDPVTELFRNGLQNAEVPIDPGVWTNISSQLGHGVAATGGSLTAWIGGGIAAALVAGGLWLGLGGSDEVPAKVAATVTVVPGVVQEVPTVETPVVTVPSSEAVKEEVAIGNEQHAVAAPLSVRVDPQERNDSENADDVKPVPVNTLPAVATETKSEVPGPFIDKVNAIIERAEERIAADPHPAEQGDTRIPPSENPETEAAEEADQETATNAVTESTHLFIPNVFTPNEDGVNDVLEVSAIGLSNIAVSIYSATNDKLVFRADNLSPWDGRDASGARCAEGYYFYAIEAIGPDGKAMSKGQVVLLNIR